MSESSASTLPPPPVATRDRARSRLRRWTLPLVLLLIAAGWFGHFAYLRITLRPTPRPEYWEAKLAELDPPPPGGIPFAEVKPKLTILPSVNETILDGNWDESREDVAKATEIYESSAFKTQLAEMHTMAEAGWCEPRSLNPYRNPTVHMGAYRHWARALVAHARWLLCHKNDRGGAVQDWLTALRLARQVRRLPDRIPQLTAISIESFVADEIIHAAREQAGAIESRQLAEQINMLLPPARSWDLLAPMKLEYQCRLEYVFVREGGDWVNVAEFASLRSGISGRRSALWNLASPAFHNLVTARRNLDRWFELQGCCDSWAQCFALETRLETRGTSEARTLTTLDGLDTWETHHALLSFDYRSRCLAEAALATLALERYHRLKRAYPEDLKLLVPEFLNHPPIDYGDRRQLRYRRTAEGYLLYSVGQDGKDDGGARLKGAEAGRELYSSGCDVVFSAMKRAELQR